MKTHKVAIDGFVSAAIGESLSPDQIHVFRRIGLPEHKWGSKNWPEIAEGALYLAGLQGPDSLAKHYLDETTVYGLGKDEGLSTVYGAWDAVVAAVVGEEAQNRGHLELSSVAREWITQWLRWAASCAVPTPKNHRFWRGSTILWPGQRSHDVKPGAVAALYDYLTKPARHHFRDDRVWKRRVRRDNYLWPLWIAQKTLHRGIYGGLNTGGTLAKLWMPIDIYSSDDGSKLVTQPPNKNNDVNTNTPPLIVAGFDAVKGKVFSIHPHTYRRKKFARMTRKERAWNVRVENNIVEAWASLGTAERRPWCHHSSRFERRQTASVLIRKNTEKLVPIR